MKYKELTAVEWFAMVIGAWKYAFKAQLEQAKEMEKKQMHAEYMRGWKDGLTKQQEQ
jgi:hypothetical protein